MSPLSRFMHTARQILQAHEAERVAPAPSRPPVFVRTNWLFVEVDEAIVLAAVLAARIKEARLANDVAAAAQHAQALAAITRQLAVLAADADRHFQKEIGSGH